MWTCSTCGEAHDDQFASCWKCQAAQGSPSAQPDRASAAQGTATLRLNAAGQGTATVANFGPATRTRYAEAYASARAFSFVGKCIKGVGTLMFLLGMVGLLAAMANSNEYGSSPADALFPGFLAMIGSLVAIMGIFLAAQAQLMMSSLDNAVHTSPFLNDVQRAETMRLRLG